MASWYLDSGKESDVVISTRIRLARNISTYPFMQKINAVQAKEIIENIKPLIETLPFGLKVLKLKDIDDVNKMALVEKHLISPEFALKKEDIGAIAINDDENISIMINEEDHLRIQVLASGLELKSSLDLALEIDRKLEQNLSYAYDPKYGFLTTCPTNTGTALRASVMVHLPALTKTGNIRKVLEVVNSFDMNIRGVYGEGTNSKGNIYQISNKQTLGVTEEDTIKNLKIITDKVIEQEKLARKIMTKKPLELEDMVYRSYGLLTNCRKISSKECEDLLSDVRLGVDLGIIKEITDLKVNKIDLYTKPANLQKKLGKTLETYSRDVERAKIIKQIVCED